MRKPIHVTITMPLWERLRFLFKGDAVHVLLQPTITGVKVVDVRVCGKSVKRETADGKHD